MCGFVGFNCGTITEKRKVFAVWDMQRLIDCATGLAKDRVAPERMERKMDPTEILGLAREYFAKVHDRGRKHALADLSGDGLQDYFFV